MPRKLLLVERDLELSDSLVEILAHRGYAVTAVATAAAAIAALRVDVPDVVLIDVTDPDQRSERLGRVLATDERLRGVQVVILSSIIGVQRELPPQTAAVMIGTPLDVDPVAELIDGLCRRLDALDARDAG